MQSLYVSNLHSGVTEGMLYEKFSKAGPVHSIRLCRDESTQQSLGCANVLFEHSADGEILKKKIFLVIEYNMGSGCF